MSVEALHALALGVVQGLAEFLPISSSAHLALLPRYMGWSDPGLAFDVALHLGTLLAVVLYFWRDLWSLAVGIVRPRDPSSSVERKAALLLILATVPAALAGLILEHHAEEAFRSPLIIACALMGLGAVLAVADRFCAGQRTLSDLSTPAAFGIGCAQALALIPGVSRSGITITVALFLGLQRREAARFSFLLSVPIIAGAGLLKAPELFRTPDALSLAAGFTAAAGSGLAAIFFLMRYVQNHRYTPFVVYRLLLGAWVLLNLGQFHG